MVTKTEDQSQLIVRSRAKMALWFGITAGVVYSLMLWGIDGIKLAAANGYAPFAKLVMGLIPTIAICVLAAWISNKSQHGLISFITWLITGALICFFASHLPYEGLKLYYKVFFPEVADKVGYTFNMAVQSKFYITLVICTVLGGISGLFFNMLVDSANNAASIGGPILTMFLWSILFIGSAEITNQLIQLPLTAPVQAINRLVVLRIQHEVSPFSKQEVRTYHLNSLNEVIDLIQKPRRLVLTNFDVSQIMTNVSVNFDGQWAECISISDQSSEPPVQQVIRCAPEK